MIGLPILALSASPSVLAAAGTLVVGAPVVDAAAGAADVGDDFDELPHPANTMTAPSDTSNTTRERVTKGPPLRLVNNCTASWVTGIALMRAEANTRPRLLRRGRTYVRYPGKVLDSFDPHEVARLRRSIAMLRPDQPASLKREEAMRILEELQRLQRSDRRHAELLDRLRAVLDDTDDRPA